jgi:DNA helicase-2/ATP-dependent DNA helicase PcrA
LPRPARGGGGGGLPKSFSIFDTADQSKAIKQAIKDVNISPDNFPPAQVLHAISNAKNKLQTPATYAAAAGGFFEKNVARAYARYEQILAENKAVDFDDLLLKMAIMLRDNEDVRRQLQERFQYILIDEYQDTNHAQFILAHMLAMNHKNICATGDPDQSIYGWRGANLNNILEFEQFYPNAKVVLLEQNYRSTKCILKAASALIANNTKRKKKDLWTDNEEGPKINLLKCNDERQEATELIARIKNKHEKEKLGWDKMAIFYRVNSLSRVLEDALMKQAIPYQIARGTEFYARKEIKDVLAYLRIINNPDDNISLERIANVPPRALGDTSVTKIATYASTRRISLLDAFRDASRIPDLTPRAKTAATKLAALFDNWRKLVDPTTGVPPENAPLDTRHSTPETPPPPDDPLFDPSLADAFANSEELSEAALAAEADAEAVDAALRTGEAADSPHRTQDSGLRTSNPPPAAKPSFLLPGGIKGLMERVVKEAGFEDEFKKQDSDGDDQGNDRLGNIGELINVAAEFDVQNPEGTLDDYLQQVTLVSDVDKIKDAGGAVTLMTLHAAKGLEFPYVSIAGMEDGLLPHARAVGFNASPDEMEEERRLAFVGITRAMKELTLSYARYRMIRGQTERTIASKFLNELPEETINEIDLTGESDSVGSLGYRDEFSYSSRAQQERQRNAEAASQRRQAQALAGEGAAGGGGGFKRGMLVRHPQFGLGRIEEIAAAGTMTKAIVRFQAAGQKTLILQYAKLERVDA